MSEANWLKRLGLLFGVLTVVHYLATGKLPFGTPELLRSDDDSDGT
jgi:DMSO/TMAO reductase YedYZ heme-binding membrane subunit